MTVTVAALSFVVDVALGSWLGVMAFFSFVGAPRAFAVFEDEGGRYVNDVFPRYYRLGVALGAVGFVAAVGLGLVVGFSGPVLVVVAAAALAVVLAGYSVGVLVPRMDAAGDDSFERFHALSVRLNGLMLLAVMVALIASHAV